LVDTALRTADSGYLTRRLVDVAQDVMITTSDCGTTEGVEIQSIKDGVTIIVSLAELIEGKYTMEDVIHPVTGQVIVKADVLISHEQSLEIQEAGLASVRVRNIYKCRTGRGLCQKCYGIDLASGKLINIGEAVGIIAAQSIGEPGTQLTMRTFHTGGVDLRRSSKVEIKAKFEGVLVVPDDLAASRINDESGNTIWVTTREGNLFVAVDKTQKRGYLIPRGSTIVASPGQKISAGEIIAEYDPSYEYIISESDGLVKLIGVDLLTRQDESGKVVETVAKKDGEVFVFNPKIYHDYTVPFKAISHYKEGDRIKTDEDLGAGNVLEIGGIITSIKKAEAKETKSGKTRDDMYTIRVCPGESYSILAGASFYVEDNSRVQVGEILARERIGASDASKTKDIVQGLPRVEELFEARKPKEAAILTQLDGIVEISDEEGYRLATILGEDGARREYKIPYGTRLKVYSGKKVRRGEQLTDGVINPHDILETKGVVATQTYLGEEVQRVYRSQGVQINSKHVEVIVRQMTRKVTIVGMGDTEFLPNELIDIRAFERVNMKMLENGQEPSVGERELLGITRASLNTESFVSASSFQQTASVLTKAAIEGQMDPMYGLKENVIIGHLIPAGTGMPIYSGAVLSAPGDELASDYVDELAADFDVAMADEMDAFEAEFVTIAAEASEE
jgi:DNA-directed RNA polymerase subunit beta'